MKLTQELVKYLFDYRDGTLYWKRSTNPMRVPNGSLAGNPNKDGYFETQINKKKYGNHRIIFLMFNGYLPEQVDHIDNNIKNNRIENLRAASYSQNQANAKLRKDNTTGFKNVKLSKKCNKFEVTVQKENKKYFFGYYDTLEEAVSVAKHKRIELYGEFARHG